MIKSFIVLSVFSLSLTGCYGHIVRQDLPYDKNQDYIYDDISNSDDMSFDDERNLQSSAPDLSLNNEQNVNDNDNNNNNNNNNKTALVDSVSVVVLESFPPRYIATVDGHFRNGCESLGENKQSVNGSMISFQLFVNSSDLICTQALVPFKESFDIDVLGLASGSYVLDVNEITTNLYVQ